MLTEREFPAANSYDLPPAGVQYVLDARANASQRVGSSPGVSCTYFPSPKTGYVEQAPSRTGEFVSHTSLEDDDDVTEYWDQAPKIKLVYQSKNGSKVGPLTRPDTLYHSRSTGWTIRETKHSACIDKEAEASPNRYCKDKDGKWRCPPGEEAAAKIGMHYEVFVPGLLDDVQHRNYNWLEDYFLEATPDDFDVQMSAVANLVEESDGMIVLEELIAKMPDPAPIYRAIGTNHVYLDKRRDLICRPKKAWVYRDKHTALAWQHAHGIRPVPRQGIQLFENAKFQWNGRPWTICRVTENGCHFLSETNDVVFVSGEQVITLIDTGEMKPSPGSEPDTKATNILKRAKSADLESANERMSAIRRFASRDQTVTKEYPARTLRRWRKRFREAEHLFNCGYIGLIPKNYKKGNRVSRLTSSQQELVSESINEDYLSSVAMGKYQAYALYVGRSKEKSCDAVTYETYSRHIDVINLMVRVQEREGKRAAYKHRGPLGQSTIPTSGDRPWEVAHADHTESEISLKSELTGDNIGRPWMSLLVDGKTKEPLARYYTFQPPSRISLMMLLRDCVRRHNRLPQRIVVDKGSDFESVYFETTLAAYWSAKVSRPAEDPHFGADGERIFRTIDTKLLGMLRGNTKAMKNVRNVSKSHDPRELAVWTPAKYLKEFDEFLFETYPSLRSTGTFESPHNRYQRLIAQAGDRPARYIPYDEKFHFMTMVAPLQPQRLVHHYGVSINHIRYWAPDLKDLVGNKRPYDVRYDPLDMTRAFIQIRGEWQELEATSPIVHEYMESGIDDGLTELMALALKAGREYRSVPLMYAKQLLRCKRDEEFLVSEREGNDNPESEDKRGRLFYEIAGCLCDDLP